MRVLGISGWSGCGKTTLIETLMPKLRSRGLRVSTLKHAHHEVDLETPGKDTWRHREAGAHETMLVTGRRWALLRELRDESEPSLAELLPRLESVDLVLVEGWKRNDYPKLEVWRSIDNNKAPCFPNDHTIIAIASDPVLDVNLYGRPELPAFSLNDADGIVDFVLHLMSVSKLAVTYS